MSHAQDEAELRRFDEAVRWVESFIRPITGTAPQKTRADWDHDGPGRLARMQKLLAALGQPERRYETLHVTGTSGKGSVCTCLGSVLRAAGRRTGVHATPYLQTPIEKLQVDGRYASATQLADLVQAFRMVADREGGAVEGMPYPALWVALTYLYFARERVETAVVEVSTGGRYDWTNTLQPAVAVVTTVGPDHLNALGPTLAEVAYHKAGIIKAGAPAVTGVSGPELRVIEDEAALQGSSLRRLGTEFQIAVRACTASGTVFDYASKERRLQGLETGMLGRYQAFNAGLAVAALDAFGERFGRIDDGAIRAGLLSARLAGRMELMQRQPDVLLDGAHNPEKAGALAAALAEVFANRRLILVIGALSTKDGAGILTPLAAQTRRAIVTVPHVLGKSGAEPERLAAAALDLGIPATVEADPATAVRLALADATPQDLVCITGSLYLVGEVRRRWVADETVLATGYSTPFESMPPRPSPPAPLSLSGLGEGS